MAVELMSATGYRNGGTICGASSQMEENAVQEAAAAGLQSVENLIRLLSQQDSPSIPHKPSTSSVDGDVDYRAAADAAVGKFKKLISLLDRTRTGHARFRRGPLANNHFHERKIGHDSEPIVQAHNGSAVDDKPISGGGVPRVYCPNPIQRLPPLPHHNHHPHQLLRNGSIERKESSTTINFAAGVSPATSFMSSLTGDTDSIQPSLSSGFQITNLSQVSSAGRPPLSSSSFKRKCSSMDDAGLKCSGGSSGKCHCPKKRSALNP